LDLKTWDALFVEEFLTHIDPPKRKFALAGHPERGLKSQEVAAISCSICFVSG